METYLIFIAPTMSTSGVCRLYTLVDPAVYPATHEHLAWPHAYDTMALAVAGADEISQEAIREATTEVSIASESG